MPNNKARAGVAGLVLSLAGFLGVVSSENFTANAVVPTKNDVPTVGFGSTVWEDGTKVKMTDKITPARALHLAQDHISKDEVRFRDSLPGVKLSQAEYDTYIDWVYQYGMGAWMKSSMRSKAIKGDFAGACSALLLYKNSGGYDCSIPGNKVCAGVWTRQKARYASCMGGL